MHESLRDKVVLVTGASQGIGAEMARRFHAAGASVILNHPDLGPTGEDAEQLAVTLNAVRPNSADVAAADVSNAIAVQRMMQDVQARRGGIDFLINNAARNPKMEGNPGGREWSHLEHYPASEWERDLAVGLTGALIAAQVFGAELARRGRWPAPLPPPARSPRAICPRRTRL